MHEREFPDPRKASVDGLVSVGGSLSVARLKQAYAQGIFPWPQEGLPILWFSPDPRAVIDFKDLHIPRSLAKWLRRQDSLKFTLNNDFKQVIHSCRVQERPGQDGSWILPELEQAYIRLHEKGLAHSLECWQGKQLVGGIYGVQSKRYFSAESMFYNIPNASKACFVKLVEHLENLGFQWMDIQMLTPVTSQLGGRYVPREEFLRRIGC